MAGMEYRSELLVNTGQSVRPADRDYPSKLVIEPTTQCNLDCRVCVREAEGTDLRTSIPFAAIALWRLATMSTSRISSRIDSPSRSPAVTAPGAWDC